MRLDGARVSTDGHTRRKSFGFRVPGLSVPRPQRRVPVKRELQLRWGSPTVGKKDHARIRALTEAVEKRARFRLEDGVSQFGKRVSFDDARDMPFHRWYFYKEGFSPHLLGLMLSKLTVARGAFLDPFAGVGTSLLAATRLRESPFTSVLGVEYNPFAHFVADTKLRWRSVQPRRLREALDQIEHHRTRRAPKVPASTTLRNKSIFSASRMKTLLEIRSGIDRFARTGAERDLLRLALASVLESASFAKKDGRALRIVSKHDRLVPPRDLFRTAVQTIARDMEEELEQDKLRVLMRQRPRRTPAHMYRGDARQLPPAIKKNSVSLALYSPPYLNGIDYSEVYKVEEYMLGFIRSSDELRRLRHGTLRSHASIRFRTRSSALDEFPTKSLVKQLLSEISAYIAKHETRPFQRQYGWLVPAYFADMADALAEQFRVLKKGGYVVCVVANSMIAGPALKAVKDGETERRYVKWQLPIATDLLLTAIAAQLGFEPQRSYVVRALYPRNVTSSSSRESILVFRKPRT
jgi:DNA modification methylase